VDGAWRQIKAVRGPERRSQRGAYVAARPPEMVIKDVDGGSGMATCDTRCKSSRAGAQTGRRAPLQFAASDVTPCARADDMAGMRVLCRLPAVLVLWHQHGSDALVLCFEV